jgi:tetratricopeptide (TPR) repeat protein
MDTATAAELLDLAEDARARTRNNDPSARTDLEACYPALLEAFDWYLDTGRRDDAYRLGSALVPFWISTKRIDDGDRRLQRAIAGPGDPGRRHARALYDHGYLVFWAGRYDLAAERFDAALELARRADDPNLVALVLAGQARVALNADVPEATRLLREAVAVTEGSAPGDGRSSALHVLGVALQMGGDLEGARDVMAARRDLASETGDEFVVWVESANMSMVERQLGAMDRAEALSRDALAIVYRRNDAMGIPWVLNGLAAVTAAKGDVERAATLNGLAAALLEAAGGEWPPDEREQYDGTLAAVAAGLSPDDVEHARAAGAAMSVDEGVAWALSD